MKDIKDYMSLCRADRRAHINLLEPCWEFGGNSSQFKAALAHKLDTSIPTGRIVLCHACHNGACSNLSHLYWGTDKDNALDRVEVSQSENVEPREVAISNRIDLAEYIKLPRETRRAHLDLCSACDERGGDSWRFRGLLAHKLKTTISNRAVYLCHACNNPGCSNALHLYWGTNYENNVVDRKEAGTWASSWENRIKKHGIEKVLQDIKDTDYSSMGKRGRMATLGRKLSEEQKVKISKSVSKHHQENPKILTAEQREKISAGKKAYYANLKEQGIVPKSYRASLSPEHREKIGEASRKRHALLKAQKEAASNGGLNETASGSTEPKTN